MKSSVLATNPSIAAELVAHGVGLIDFPDALVTPVTDGWLHFLLKNQGEKDRWTFTNTNNPDDPEGKEGADDGYICRNREARFDGVLYDQKEFFHYKRALPKFLDNASIDTSRETEWLESLKRLHTECVGSFLAVTAMLEDYFPGQNLLAAAMRGVDLGLPTLRLIYYKQAEETGEEIAKMHGDRNSLTLALVESLPGLVYRDKTGRLVEYAKSPNRVLAFPGKKLEKQLGPTLPALRHGVLAHPEAIGKRRCTAVFFGHDDTFLTLKEKSAR